MISLKFKIEVVDGIPALDVWDLIVAVLGSTNENRKEQGDLLRKNVKFVLQLPRFTNASNLRE